MVDTAPTICYNKRVAVNTTKNKTHKETTHNMSKKMNLNKLTMAFATAAQVPTPDADVEATRAMVTQKIADIKQKKAKKTDTDAAAEPAVKAVKEPKVKAADKVKEPKAPKKEKAAEKKERSANSELSSNFRTFQVVGTTLFKGARKMWFANETATKVKNMEKQGHTEIDFINLPNPMTKEQTLAYLVENPELLPMDLVTEKQERFSGAAKGKKAALTTPAE